MLQKTILNFPDLSLEEESFQFGLEAEFLLVEIPGNRPLWHRDLNFKQLNEIIENIPLDGIKGSYDYLDIEPPHRRKIPYVVEGYHVMNENDEKVDILPKGLEIRTPVSRSIEECLANYQLLFERMQEHLALKGLKAVSLSHHPLENEFSGKQGKRRHDYWQWAMEVMTTYGPDINVSLPTGMLHDFNLNDFERKINYYAPAFTASSVASPILNGKVWMGEEGKEGKSFRTYKRSIIAPPIEYHPEEGNRMEFKVFEMSPYREDFHVYFLLFLSLLLDKKLSGRASKYERIYEMGKVAVSGLQTPGIKEKLNQVLASAPQCLSQFGFDHRPLERLERKVGEGITLADELIGIFHKNNSLSELLEHVSFMRS